MAEVLPIERDLIPYTFDIVLSNVTYTFGINYNSLTENLTVDLIRDGVNLVRGEKITLGIPLFEAVSHDSNGNRDSRFFNELLVPYDFSNIATNVTYNNIQNQVFIWIMTRT